MKSGLLSSSVCSAFEAVSLALPNLVRSAANAAYLMRHRGTGSHCSLLSAPGHQADEPPGVALSRRP